GHYCDPDMEALIKQIRSTFDPAEQAKVVQKMHEKNVDNALFLMVAHDVAPRAMSAKVKGFVPAQNWFPSLTTVTIEE
ncbi:MAG: ABC transporter substrate-binding protein, partial [Stutzerimonas stutzeri]